MRQIFSIRYKFLFVTCLLLAFCIASYLLMATTVIRKDKTNLVYDYNQKLVTNIAGEIEGLFQSASDKMQLLAFFF